LEFENYPTSHFDLRKNKCVSNAILLYSSLSALVTWSNLQVGEILHVLNTLRVKSFIMTSKNYNNIAMLPELHTNKGHQDQHLVTRGAEGFRQFCRCFSGIFRGKMRLVLTLMN